MNTTPVYDGSKPAPWFARVHFPDALGRCMPKAFDQFRTRKAAAAYWWALARRGVVAFLPDENQHGRTNAGLARHQEPAELRAWIDQAEREHIDGDADHCEGAEFARVCSIFQAARS